jgi:5-enolpyruvylshikimate-3-phosphate synthase
MAPDARSPVHRRRRSPPVGRHRPSGNKNAALPIVAATVLTDQPVVLENVPRIRDIETLVELVRSLGAEIDWVERNTLHVHARTVRAQGAGPRALGQDPRLDPARRLAPRPVRPHRAAAARGAT